MFALHGIGSLIYGIVFFLVINSNNESANASSDSSIYYSIKILDKVPQAYRLLAIISLI